MITQDTDFKQALDKLGLVQQRRVGAAFVRNVLALNPAVTKVVDAAANEDTTADELAVAFKQAKVPAWEAAVNARMARTCGHIDASDESMHEESEAQYRLLEQFLNDI